jgi:hypothetical protein
MVNFLVGVAWIFYRLEIFPCAYAPKLILSWKTTCLRPLLALVAYTWFFFSICCCTLSWSVFTTYALWLPSKLIILSIDKWIKSMGVKWLNSYIILNGENSIVECTVWLYANSTNDKQSFQFFKFFWMTTCRSYVKVLLTTSVCPSV